MSKVFQHIRTGINLGQLTTDPLDPQLGDLYFNTTTNTFRQYISGAWHNIVADDLVQTLSNKSLVDTTTAVVDSIDATKKILFDAGGTTSTTTTIQGSQTANIVLTLPNVTDTLAALAAPQLLTNKQIGYSVANDTASTGPDAVLAAPTTGIVRLTLNTLTSVGGIAGGTAGLQLILDNDTTNQISIINEDLAVATVANRITTGTGSNVLMPVQARFIFTYDAIDARWQLTGGSGSGSGGGSKNYLTPIVTSTSGGATNIGNGNFEFGSTAGWSLKHSTLTSLIPTTAPSGAATALSLQTVTGGNQLDGTYSAEVISTAIGTAGDMLISSPFNIDAADQGKILSWSFNYKAISNTGGTFNFSGTSANTFAVYIYDVTNAVWIQPVGVYNMVQGTGVGVATGSFLS